MSDAWTDASRAQAFWFLCIPLRALIATLAVVTPPGSRERHAVALLLLGLGCSQMFLYLTNGRPSAPEGGGDTWWAPVRVLFGSVFLASAAVAYRGPTDAWRYFPYADPVLGALVWMMARPGAGDTGGVQP